jgi:hypothetical protein
MGLTQDAMSVARRLVERLKNAKVARNQKAESDIEADAHVAGARDGGDGAEGEYVGRTNPQFDADVQETGAEARSESARLASDDPSP